MNLVLDASAGIPLVHSEPESGRWRALAAARERAGDRFLVPDHFWLEVSNALVRRHGYAGAEVLEALHILDDVVTETVEIGRATLLLAIDHAERYGLTVYDAGYLALAETLDADLATADEALRRVAADRLADRASDRRLSESTAAYGAGLTATWPDYSGAASYLAALRVGLRADAAH
jgi:predicted nucleic acid-binding protein